MSANEEFPAAQNHGDIREIFDDVYLVTGSAVMRRPLPLRFSRNMTIVRNGEDLTLVNSVRLDDSGLRALDELGTVRNVMRIAGFHGMDDPFYKRRYGARVWSVDAAYAPGLEPNAASKETALQPDVVLDDTVEMPIADAELVNFNSCTPREALLLLHREGGILVAGDCLQNWQRTDQYFNLFAKFMMKRMGFIKPYNIGPGWLKYAAPDVNEIKSLLDLPFEHVLPAHGEVVIGGAKSQFRPVISSL